MPLLACLLLCACATSTQSGRAQLSVPAPVSAVYSEVDMRVQLATAAVAVRQCEGVGCARDRAFDRQVQRLGARLATAAFAAYPALSGRFDHFEIVVADNGEAGSASSAAGTIAIFRGVQGLHFDEPALAFLIAREMAHVIEGHHDENSATSILFSLLAQVVMPVTNLVRGAASIIPSGAAAAATTTTSFIGARVVRASNRPEQLREADILALDLLARQGWYGREVAQALDAGLAALPKDDWSDDVRNSAVRIALSTQGPARYPDVVADATASASTVEARELALLEASVLRSRAGTESALP